jgi:hypothetical protein
VAGSFTTFLPLFIFIKMSLKTENKSESEIIKLLENIEKYRFGWDCDCPTCKDIRKRIKKELKELAK